MWGFLFIETSELSKMCWLHRMLTVSVRNYISLNIFGKANQYLNIDVASGAHRNEKEQNTGKTVNDRRIWIVSWPRINRYL